MTAVTLASSKPTPSLLCIRCSEVSYTCSVCQHLICKNQMIKTNAVPVCLQCYKTSTLDESHSDTDDDYPEPYEFGWTAEMERKY